MARPRPARPPSCPLGLRGLFTWDRSGVFPPIRERPASFGARIFLDIEQASIKKHSRIGSIYHERIENARRVLDRWQVECGLPAG